MTNPFAPGTIELRVRELSQLFDALDPSPFAEKDLDPRAEAYIVESFRELPTRTASELVVHLDRPAGIPEQDSAVASAIRHHFARQARHLQRKLRLLIRRGLVSFGIGLAFLALVFVISQGVGRLMGESPLGLLVNQGLLIVGWVAMWRPLEIFLYDWWPIVGERRIHQRLSRVTVRIARGPEPGRPE